MKSDRDGPVAIIGGGASGTILAAQLARRGIDAILIEGSGRAGKGVAYSTTEPAHLLNVRAEGMSAWAGEPDHFVRRFEQEGGDRRSFAERRLFGRYLNEILEEAVGSGKARVLNATALAADRTDAGWRVRLESGQTVNASALVLATGNQEPDVLRAFAGVEDRLIGNPWGDRAQAAVRDLVDSGGDVLLIGTGLTMVDLVLSLDAAGHRGRIVAVSRRGQIPRGHADFEPAPVDADQLPSGSLRGMWRWLRRRSAEVGWRAAVDSLRPHSHPLWQSLDEEQQRRFLRHARPWWDVHRHRIAPQVADTVAGMIADGRLQILAGRITGARSSGDGLEVDIRRRGAAEPQTMQFDYAFNCTGPLHSLSHTRDPLLRSLLDAGAVRPDHLGIGLEVDENSHAVGAQHLWALGPLTKGRYWEIIAVPDIREQAAAVADDIARELSE
jgi:uncharacterized NAD(P)/FAD-binding protein YdhS